MRGCTGHWNPTACGGLRSPDKFTHICMKNTCNHMKTNKGIKNYE